jgi:hypothetical protein
MGENNKKYSKFCDKPNNSFKVSTNMEKSALIKPHSNEKGYFLLQWGYKEQHSYFIVVEECFNVKIPELKKQRLLCGHLVYSTKTRMLA